MSTFIIKLSHPSNHEHVFSSTKNSCEHMFVYPVTSIRHYNDVIMGTIASQITSLTIVYSTVYSDADQSKHQSSASLAFVRGIHRGPVNSPHKWPVTRKMFPFDDVIMKYERSFEKKTNKKLCLIMKCSIWYHYACSLDEIRDPRPRILAVHCRLRNNIQRIVIASLLFGAASRVPGKSARRNWQSCGW